MGEFNACPLSVPDKQVGSAEVKGGSLMNALRTLCSIVMALLFVYEACSAATQEAPQADAVVPLVSDLQTLPNLQVRWKEAGKEFVSEEVNVHYWLAGVDVVVFPVWQIVAPVEILAQDGWRPLGADEPIQPQETPVQLRMVVRNLWADSAGAGASLEEVFRQRVARKHGLEAKTLRLLDPKVRLPFVARLKVTLEGAGEQVVSEPAWLTREHLESRQGAAVRFTIDGAGLAEATKQLGHPVTLTVLRLQCEMPTFARLETRIAEGRLDAVRRTLAELRDEIQSQVKEAPSYLIFPGASAGEARNIFRDFMTEKLTVDLGIREQETADLGAIVEKLLEHTTIQLRRALLKDEDRVGVMVQSRLGLASTVGEVKRFATLDKQAAEKLVTDLWQHGKAEYTAASGGVILGAFGLGGQRQWGQQSVEQAFREQVDRSLREAAKLFEGKIAALPALDIRQQVLEQAFQSFSAEVRQSRFLTGYFPVLSSLIRLPLPVGSNGASPVSAVLVEPPGDDLVGFLLKRLEEAEEGATIELKDGIYLFRTPFRPTKSVTLIGTGSDRTVFVAQSPAPIILLDAEVGLTIKNVSFVQNFQGSDPVVVVGRGTLSLDRCSFVRLPLDKSSQTEDAGAPPSDEQQQTVSNAEEGAEETNNPEGHAVEGGILIAGSSRGTIRNCTFRELMGRAVAIQDQADVTIEGSTLSANESGVQISGSGQARIVNNQIVGSTQGPGIVVEGTAMVLLEGNQCRNNAEVQIRFIGESKGEIRKNSCEGGKSGITVADNATPLVVENHCKSHSEAGIDVAGKARPMLSGNRCELCGVGIQIRGDAHITAEGNQCMKNERSGIAIFERASARLTNKNICSENKGSGIFATDRAELVAEDNICSQNGGQGIEIRGNVNATVRQNQLLQNSRNGVGLFGAAKAEIISNMVQRNSAGIWVDHDCWARCVNNTCEASEQSGIFFTGSSRGSAEGNECKGNGLDGIQVGELAVVELVGNNCSGNSQNGIGVWGRARVTAQKNTCQNNTANGIHVWESGYAELTANVCIGNGSDGICWSRSATGVVKGNQLSNNGRRGMSIFDQAKVTTE